MLQNLHKKSIRYKNIIKRKKGKLIQLREVLCGLCSPMIGVMQRIFLLKRANFLKLFLNKKFLRKSFKKSN
jgi:hypothetical protein